MKIVFASDHVALELKAVLKDYVTELGHDVSDVGADSAERTDYPIWGSRAAEIVASGQADRGIVLCGTGVGISISANKVDGIRCACVSEPYSARLSRQHNDSNVLAMGARVVGIDLAKMIVAEWLGGQYEGGRHARRVDQLSALERSEQL